MNLDMVETICNFFFCLVLFSVDKKYVYTISLFERVEKAQPNENRMYLKTHYCKVETNCRSYSTPTSGLNYGGLGRCVKLAALCLHPNTICNF